MPAILCALPGCKEAVTPARQRRHALYCSTTCGRIAYNRKHKRLNPHNVSTGVTGTVSELRVCADLLEHGFAVFRAVSPSCVCDLAILRGKKLLRVEVTTGHESSGKVRHLKKDRSKFDLLAVALPNRIVYEPPLSSLVTENG